jgi:AbiU2
MNPDQDKHLLSTTTTTAQHLVFAWNDSATRRGLHQYARECPAILDRNGHFVASVTYALWDSLFLKLSRCSDNRKEAIGFPKLIKQLRAYLPERHELTPQLRAQERRLRGLDVQKKVENWRNQVAAHHTIASDFNTFHKMNVVSLNAIERAIGELDETLHIFTIPLWSQWYIVRDLGPHARAAVDQFLASMKKEAEHQNSPNP